MSDEPKLRIVPGPPPMATYFYSLGILVRSDWGQERPTLTAMDLLEVAIADEERPPHTLIAFLFKPAHVKMAVRQFPSAPEWVRRALDDTAWVRRALVFCGFCNQVITFVIIKKLASDYRKRMAATERKTVC